MRKKDAPRLEREKRTVAAMVGMYCRARHAHASGLCSDCESLLHYSLGRVDACRFAQEKPVCAQCMVHCYSPSMRDRMRNVMRFSGPRMILRHPVMAILHLHDAALRRPGPANGRGKP